MTTVVEILLNGVLSSAKTLRLWTLSTGIAFMTCAMFVLTSYADPPADGGGGTLPTVVEKLEVKWYKPNFGNSSCLMENGNLYLVPRGNSALYAKGQVSFATSGSKDHAPGTIELRIPEMAFTGRDGAKTGQAVNLGVSSLDGWAKRVDAATGEIVVYNIDAKPPAMEYFFEVDYRVIRPMEVVDMAESGRLQASITIDDGADGVVARESNVVTAFVDTQTTLDNVIKEPIYYFPKWQEHWGQEPSDSVNYFYVVYHIRAQANNPSQPYLISVADTPMNGGELVGFGKTSELVGRVNYTSYTYYGRFTEGETFSRHIHDNIYNTHYVEIVSLVRYPKTLIEDGQVHVFTNSVVATLVSDDDHIATSATNSTVFTYYGDNVMNPGELFQVAKDKNVVREGEADAFGLGNRIEGIRHLLLATAKCFDSTLPSGANPQQVASYNQRTNTFELIDDFIRFEDAPDHALTSDDYEIDALQFCDMSFESTGVKLVTNNLGVVSLAGGGSADYAFGEVKVWGKLGSDEWTLVGTLVRDDARTNDSLWQFVAAVAGASCEYNTESLYDEKFPSALHASHGVAARPFSKIFLPENCTGIRLEAASAGSSINMGSVYVTYSIKPSDFVKSVVAGKSRVNVWNYDTFVVRDDRGRVIGPYESFHLNYDPDSLRLAIAARDAVDFGCEVGHSAAKMEMTPVEKKGFVEKVVLSSVSNVNAKRRDVVYALAGYEFTSAQHMPDLVAAGVFVPQSSGTFYDLLPLGMEADVEATKVYRYQYYENSVYHPEYTCGPELLSSQYEITTTPNWHGTGRTLLTIAIHGVADNWNASSHSLYYCSGFRVNVSAYYPVESVMDYGAYLLNVMAYESGNDAIASGSSDTGIFYNGTRFLGDLDGDGVNGGAPRRYLYAYLNHSVDLLMSAEAGLTGRVRAQNADVSDWITGVACNNDGTLDLPADATYQYRIRTATTKDTWKTDIILYDSIENYEPEDGSEDFGNPRWRGVLEGVDVSQISKSGIQPVIYYSTVPGLNIQAHSDLTDAPTWSLTAPSDLSTVTAVAVDCRRKPDGSPAVLEPSHSLVAILNMRTRYDSPEFARLCLSDAHAYNQVHEHSSILNGNGSSSTQMIHNEYTKVGLLPPIFTSNIHGLLKISSPFANTIIPAPWKGYTRDGSPTNDIRVDRLVKPRNLTDGDMILQYSNGGVYKAWTLERTNGVEGVWTPMGTEAQMPVVDGSTNVVASLHVPPTGDETQKRGYGMWLWRQRPVDEDDQPIPFYLYGQWMTGVETVTIGGVDENDVAIRYAGAQYSVVHDTMLADPDCTRASVINLHTWAGFDTADTIILNTDLKQSLYCFRRERPKRSGGGYYDGWWMWGEGGYTTNNISTLPGVGFWYERRAPGDMELTWEGPGRYPGEGRALDVWIVDHADAGDGKTHLAFKFVGKYAPTTITTNYISELFDSGSIRYLHATGDTQAEGKAEMDRLSVNPKDNALVVSDLRNGTGVNTPEELAKGWIWVTVDVPDGTAAKSSRDGTGDTNGAGDLWRIVVGRGVWPSPPKR